MGGNDAIRPDALYELSLSAPNESYLPTGKRLRGIATAVTAGMPVAPMAHRPRVPFPHDKARVKQPPPRTVKPVNLAGPTGTF